MKVECDWPSRGYRDLHSTKTRGFSWVSLTVAIVLRLTSARGVRDPGCDTQHGYPILPTAGFHVSPRFYYELHYAFYYEFHVQGDLRRVLLRVLLRVLRTATRSTTSFTTSFAHNVIVRPVLVRVYYEFLEDDPSGRSANTPSCDRQAGGAPIPLSTQPVHYPLRL